MTPVLHLDWETKSACDLKVAGLANYAAHPTTDIILGAWAFDDEEPELWEPGQPCPERIRKHIEEGGEVHAFNAMFEWYLWNYVVVKRYGWPPLKLSQLRCVMVRCYSMALPGALGNAAAALGLKNQKDAAGNRLMLQMCKPREIRADGTILWWDGKEKRGSLGGYCRQDLRTERETGKRTMAISPNEQELWELDAKINHRGIYIDIPAIRAAIGVVRLEQDRLDAAMRKATDERVGRCTETAAITKWVRGRGVPVEGIAKADVIEALADEDLPSDVRDVLRLRQEANKTSTAKLQTMLDAVSSDGRIRGVFQFHGAATGRWAGRRIQPHNYVRPKLKHEEIEQAIASLLRWPNNPKLAAQYLGVFHGAPLDVISWSLRAMLKAAPGNVLYAADFANIEGRGLPWLAGEEKKLERFRAADAGGPGVYESGAARILGKRVEDVTEFERQAMGKVPELFLQYQGGVGAFQNGAKIYGVKVSDEEAERIKQGWRDDHPRIVDYWYALQQAAHDAIWKGGLHAVGPAGREVSFRTRGSFLWCRLPSGRVLCYPYPRIDDSHTYMRPDGTIKVISGREKAKLEKDGKLPEDWTLGRSDSHVIWYMSVNGLTNKWEETHTYGGKLSENVTQAICRDLLAAAMVNAEHGGYPVVLHVHDEVVSETAKDFGNLAEFERLCSTTPAWARGLPVVAKGWTGERYRKA